MVSYLNQCPDCGAALDPGEKCDCQKTELPAIVCTQPPVISENLTNFRASIETLTADVDSLPVNDESLKYLKGIRADLAKEFDRLEQERKTAKKMVMAPYEAAEKKYNDYIKSPYTAADQKLKRWIDGYQDKLKAACTDTLKAYFTEACQAKGIDFIPFSRCGIAVDMAMARKKDLTKVMEQIDQCIAAVRQDMDTIVSMENADEVMAEYRKYPVLSEAVLAVSRRKQEQAAAKAYVSQQKDFEQKKQEAMAKLLEAAPELKPKEETYTTAFRATGTLAALKAMKAYALSLGITFENIKEDNDNE